MSDAETDARNVLDLLREHRERPAAELLAEAHTLAEAALEKYAALDAGEGPATISVGRSTHYHIDSEGLSVPTGKKTVSLIVGPLSSDESTPWLDLGRSIAAVLMHQRFGRGEDT